MKHCLRFALLLFIFNSCSKSPDIDPRDQYIGDYKVIGQFVITQNSKAPIVINSAASGIWKVVKGTDVNQVSIIDDDNQYITLNMSGSAFTMVPAENPLDKGHFTTGSGSFTKNSFTMKTHGESSTGIRQDATMTGTKQ